MSEEKKAPKKLDWVKAKSECSIDALYIALRAVVEFDMKAADSRSGEQVEFRITEPAQTTFMVERRLIDRFISVSVIGFDREKDGIAVYFQDPHKKTPMFTAKPHVDLDGECKFEVEGKPMEAWQVSKAALEQFFFELGLSPKPSSN
jgi:hypothetical protein